MDPGDVISVPTIIVIKKLILCKMFLFDALFA